MLRASRRRAGGTASKERARARGGGGAGWSDGDVRMAPSPQSRWWCPGLLRSLLSLLSLLSHTYLLSLLPLHHWRPSTGITAHLRSPSSGSRGSATQATAACAAVATAWLHKGRGPRDPVQQGGGHDDSCDDLPKCLLGESQKERVESKEGWKLSRHLTPLSCIEYDPFQRLPTPLLATTRPQEAIPSARCTITQVCVCVCVSRMMCMGGADVAWRRNHVDKVFADTVVAIRTPYTLCGTYSRTPAPL